MTIQKKNLVLAAAVAVAVAAPAAFATNGMNMQGYGPIAYGMGGASMAYDNGTAATMNNPATLALMGQGSRFDLALGVLMPDVSSKMTGASADSGGTAYYMPAVGYARKNGPYTYGFGIFAQGGMGTEYKKTDFLAMASGDDVRSELGVGRLIFPIAYEVNPNVTVGASLDYVWATLDLKMAATTAQLGGLVTGGSGALYGALGGLMGMDWARIDFSGGGAFSGAAKGAGFAGKLGAVFKVNPAVSVGVTYHSETSLGDLTTESKDTDLSAGMFGGAPGFTDSGKISVNNFQWPATFAVGVAWNASKDLMVAADIKQIGWKSVMKNFEMTYKSAEMGGSIDVALPQKWKDQTVYQVGFSYKVSDPMTVRAGVNMSQSQIPDENVFPLFPAIMENHYTFGIGYALDKNADVNFGYAYAPQVEAKDANGVTSSAGGQSFQVMYSNRY